MVPAQRPQCLYIYIFQYIYIYMYNMDVYVCVFGVGKLLKAVWDTEKVLP